jgi:hypothetical protein
MSRNRGYTIVELVTAMGVGVVVATMIASLWLTTTRAIETELARSALSAGAREVSHHLKRDVRRADSVEVSGNVLTLEVGGETVTYMSDGEGVHRRIGGGSQTLGLRGMGASFSVVGQRGVQVTVSGERLVRSRAVAIRRELMIARRAP